MIKDYKKGADPYMPTTHRFRPIALLGLPLALSASALYAALQILEPASGVKTATQPLQAVSLALPKPAPQRSSPSEAVTAAPAIPSEPPSLTAMEADDKAIETASAELKPDQAVPIKAADLDWKEHQIRSGDNLATIFPKLGLNANLLHRIINSSKTAANLAHVKPGETLRAALDANGQLQKLELRRNALSSLWIRPDADSFRAEETERQPETRTTYIGGSVKNSLFLSAQDAGLSDRLIMELANIFGWDIDFALDIREGDRFTVLYEEDYLDGEKFRDGAILAAEFINQGKTYRAVLYTDAQGDSGYYSPDGLSMRKAFLRSPVDFRRISSGFQRERYHPVLGVKRPHRGVDYAAAIGTPIKAAGDGKVAFRGKKGGYGNTIVIQHGGTYSTLYGHLSKFARNISAGSRVKQGQTIGYVGKTGLATGPHLHYEFLVNGIHRNPLTVKLPAADPIPAKYRTDFLAKTSPLLSRLAVVSQTMVAEAR